jgi:hypothetical protein
LSVRYQGTDAVASICAMAHLSCSHEFFPARGRTGFAR